MRSNLAIKTQGLTKQYGQTLAVNKLDLEIEAGQFYGLLGPNGAGKSTMIKSVLDLVPKASGNVTFFGKKYCQILDHFCKKKSFFFLTFFKIFFLSFFEVFFGVFGKFWTKKSQKKPRHFF